jgi:hypothetical protein
MWGILASAAEGGAEPAKDRVAVVATNIKFVFVIMSTPLARCDEGRVRRHCGPVPLIPLLGQRWKTVREVDLISGQIYPCG